MNQKRNSRSITNPLSVARHSLSSVSPKSNANNDKKIHAPALIWHRKSGDGYALFLEYYNGQPFGVVIENPTSSGECLSNSLVPTSTKNCCLSEHRIGLSRASKKRRRNKLKSENNAALSFKDDSISIQQETSTKPKNLTLSLTLSSSSFSSSSELLQIFHNMPANHHLRQHLKEFSNCLSQPLPITFRIRCLRNASINKELSTFLHQLTNQYDTLITSVSLNSSNSYFTFYQSLPILCKENLKSLHPDLHKVLHEATISGLIARQDVGSMLPVLAMATLKYMVFGSKVLDLCASPGSKTMQALEVITYSTDDNNNDDDKESAQLTCPPAPDTTKLGRIISNDINSQRLLALQDAIRRSGIPMTLLKRITYTNYDACVFPTPKSGKLFDCVLADVPCSGDGTIRKDKTILPGWMPTIANALHSTQLSILKRALELVRVGGIVAYSTCSLNPVENEAVVGAALQWTKQVNLSISLVQWPDSILPTLKRRPGIFSWRVADYDINAMTHLSTVDDEKDKETNLIWLDQAIFSEHNSHLPQTLWPKQEYQEYALNKCIRLWPQDQNTGGFFLALLRKNHSIP